MPQLPSHCQNMWLKQLRGTARLRPVSDVARERFLTHAPRRAIASRAMPKRGGGVAGTCGQTMPKGVVPPHAGRAVRRGAVLGPVVAGTRSVLLRRPQHSWP